MSEGDDSTAEMPPPSTHKYIDLTQFALPNGGGRAALCLTMEVRIEWMAI